MAGGGCTVVGDVLTVFNDEMRQSREADRPDQLSTGEMAAIARRIAAALEL